MDAGRLGLVANPAGAPVAFTISPMARANRERATRERPRAISTDVVVAPGARKASGAAPRCSPSAPNSEGARSAETTR
jgi:hypothetical protein